jgi:hypothetical protein
MMQLIRLNMKKNHIPSTVQIRELITTCPITGSKTVEALPPEGLVFRSVDHMLNAIVHRDFGESVTERIAAQACIKMADKSRQELQALQTPETRAALNKIRDMSAMELHELSKNAYLELCSRSAQASAGK